jgi:hypothetical protein
LGGVHRIADQLPDKNVMFTVKELFDDREDVFRLNPDISFLHGILIFGLWPKIKESAIVAGLTHCQGGISLLFRYKTRSFAARFTLLGDGFYETIIIKTDHEQLRIDGDFYPCTL